MQKPHLIKASQGIYIESRHFLSEILSHSSSCSRCCMRQGDCSCKQVNQSQTSEPDTAQMLTGVLWVCDFKQMSATSAPPASQLTTVSFRRFKSQQSHLWFTRIFAKWNLYFRDSQSRYTIRMWSSSYKQWWAVLWFGIEAFSLKIFISNLMCTVYL